MADNKRRGPPGETPEWPAEHAGAAAPYIRSQELFGTAQEVVIEHNQRKYRLRITSQDKLILTA